MLPITHSPISTLGLRGAISAGALRGRIAPPRSTLCACGAYRRSLTTASTRVSSRHSYQPHPQDHAPTASVEGSSSSIATPSTTTLEEGGTITQWKPSRPHEQYLLSHPVYTRQDLESIQVLYLPPKTWSDRIARFLVNFSRKGFDFVTRYKHASPEAAERALRESGKESLTLQEKRDQGFVMTVDQWMARILFLESIAGVPGFTAGILRHLRSLRLMKRDGGWINTLLQEAENERMHLLTFMKIKEPSVFFRLMVLAAQGVFFNLFFVSYILSPRACHRFVGYLEEEACYTYTHAIEALDKGELPEWEPGPGKQKVPTVAKDYWRLGDNATMRDMILAVRADEAGHRFVNHTLANLSQDDFNPVALKHASPVQQGQLPGFTREQGLEWANQVEREMRTALDSTNDSLESGGSKPSTTKRQMKSQKLDFLSF
ncbi:alternative oxidase [Sporobolomyces koalae]|uniref:alternative oxidase n=1 Tax=Sporobolomyces koalae TaxID=500713 RepID=UPI003174E3B0